MKSEKANKIIAEFMGTEEFIHKCRSCGSEPEEILYYTKSLDALVPVWEKLDMPRILEMDVRGNSYAKSFGIRLYGDLKYEIYEDHSTSIQEAAAIATAKAILELKG